MAKREEIFDQIQEKCEHAAVSIGSAGCILVVDDEDYVVSLIREVLGGAGYDVRSAGSADEAFEISAEFADKLALLITDVRMPGMDGYELAKTLVSICPHVRVLFISGFPDSGELENLIAEGGAFFLQKPFSPATLIAKVQDILAHNNS